MLQFIGFGRTALALLLVAAAPSAASAQEQHANHVGDVKITAGVGTALLNLPDQKFLTTLNAAGRTNSRIATGDDLADTVGVNLNGALEAPLAADRAISISGFWARLKDTDNATCTSAAGGGATCVVNSLNAVPPDNLLGSAQLTSRNRRDVDHGGLAIEIKQYLSRDVHASHARGYYISLGADWRAIYQDTDLDVTARIGPALDLRYRETLDTNYYGAFAAFGGNYRPFILADLWDKLGLVSSFRVQGGIYHADTDYSGTQFDEFDRVTPFLNTSASDSRSDVAFIGGVSLKTTRQLSARMALSLQSDFEYYSYAPSMNYNDLSTGSTGPNAGTSIGKDDAFSARTSLRLTVKLGGE